MMISVILAMGLLLPTAEQAANGEVLVLHDRGAWCWFQDERAIVDRGRAWWAW